MRTPGPRVTCPSCGREVGSYVPAIPVTVGHVRTVRHKRMGPVALRAHKATGAPWCWGGEVNPGAWTAIDCEAAVHYAERV